ncbi:PQQ-binding-like beta-propeller repeat protein [Rickettsiales bacterium]|nr:PQQ-binding-like beta-propeller repeat protein [Rickettsiales bacterium]
MIKIIKLIIAFSFLVGCQATSDYLDSFTTDERLKGERYSILQAESKIRPDYSIENMQVYLPYPEENKRWYKSSGFSLLTPEHPRASRSFTFEGFSSRSMGKGSKNGQHLSASPIVAKGKVISLDGTGAITAVDALNIKKQYWRYENDEWKYDISTDLNKIRPAYAGMSYYEDVIYATTGYDQVIAINIDNGEEVWKRKLSGITRSAPAVRNGRVFVITAENKLYAISARDGSILWTHSAVVEDISTIGSASPVVVDNLVLVPYSSGDLYALDVETGKEVWADSFISGRSDISSYEVHDINTTPVVSRGNVYIISNDGVLAASDVKTGIRIWEQDIAGDQAPWVAGDFLFVINNLSEVICIHTKTGGVRWVKQLPEYKNADSKSGKIRWSGPVLAGGDLLVVGSHGVLSRISPQTGKISSSETIDIPDNIFISPIVAYDTVYLYSDDAKLLALRGNDILTLDKITGQLDEGNKSASSKQENESPISLESESLVDQIMQKAGNIKYKIKNVLTGSDNQTDPVKSEGK